MAKALLMSIIVAIIAIPAYVARRAGGRAGLRKTVVRLLLFDAFYWFALIYVWGRL